MAIARLKKAAYIEDYAEKKEARLTGAAAAADPKTAVRAKNVYSTLNRTREVLPDAQDPSKMQPYSYVTRRHDNTLSLTFARVAQGRPNEQGRTARHDPDGTGRRSSTNFSAVLLRRPVVCGGARPHRASGSVVDHLEGAVRRQYHSSDRSAAQNRLAQGLLGLRAIRQKRAPAGQVRENVYSYNLPMR